MSFKVFNKLEKQITSNQQKVNSTNIDFLDYSVQKNKGGTFFFGRGGGFTGGQYTARYLSPANKINLEYLIIYFDTAATESIDANSTVGIIIFGTNPAWGETPEPVCDGTGGTAGANLYPGGGVTDFYTFKDTDITCINHGRDPRNATSNPIAKRSYIKIDINVECPASTSLSLRMNPTQAWTQANPADITAELYYTMIQ